MNLRQEEREELVAVFAGGAGPQTLPLQNWALMAYRVESIGDLISFISKLVEAYEVELEGVC